MIATAVHEPPLVLMESAAHEPPPVLMENATHAPPPVLMENAARLPDSAYGKGNTCAPTLRIRNWSVYVVAWPGHEQH